MLDIREFHPTDLVGFRPQGHQLEEFESFRDVPQGINWTILHRARPVCCGGFVELWPGRAYAWSLLSEDAGPLMLGLTREIRSLLAEAPFARIEMAVEANFEAGRRWAVLLGFSCETPEPMRHFLPSGRAAYLYARIR